MEIPIRPSARLRGISYGVVAQISVICLINYMDRTTLAIANPAIRHDMGLSLSQMGLLLSAFPLPTRWPSCRSARSSTGWGSRLLLGIGLALWSLAQGLAGIAASAGQLWACRIALGIGEAPTPPSCTKAVRRWFNVRERGKPVGVFTGANHLGQAISAPVLTLIMVALGWHLMFAIMGILGLICAVLWFALYRDPDHAALSDSDRAHLVEGDTMHDAPPMNLRQWQHLFAFRTSWGLFCSGCSASGYVSGIYATWLPAYLEIDRHLSIKQAGMAAAIPFTLAVVGSLFAGWAADLLGRRGVSPLNSGRIVFVTGLLGLAVFTLLTAQAAASSWRWSGSAPQCSSASFPDPVPESRRARRCRKTVSARSAACRTASTMSVARSHPPSLRSRWRPPAPSSCRWCWGRRSRWWRRRSTGSCRRDRSRRGGRRRRGARGAALGSGSVVPCDRAALTGRGSHAGPVHRPMAGHSTNSRRRSIRATLPASRSI